MNLPAGTVRTMDLALNTYGVIESFLRASSQHKSVEWSQNNPKEWDFVSAHIARRKGIE